MTPTEDRDPGDENHLPRVPVCWNCLHDRSSHDDSGRCLEIVWTGRGATGYVPCLCRGFGTPEIAARAAYASHRFVGGLASGPADPPDHVSSCADCGCEDYGDPAEFPGLAYPICDLGDEQPEESES